MRGHPQTEGRLRSRVGLVASWWPLVIAVVWFVVAPPAGAQTLDEAVASQLSGDCLALGGENPAFGDDLNAICTQSFGSPTGNANSGGAGASSQTLGVSVENRRKSRLEQEGTGKETEKGAEPASGQDASLAKRWGLFVTGNAESLDRERTHFADGFDSTIQGLTVGGDYRFSNRMIAGAMFTYLRNDGDFDAGGDFDTDSQGITLYASFVPSPATFFDLSAGFARKDHGVNRRANFVEFDNGGNTNTFDGIVNSDTDGEEISVGGSFGYDRSKGSFTYGPRFSLNWIQTRIDGYSEAGGGAGTVPVGGIRGAAGLALVYAEQEVDSLQSVVGFQGSVASSKGFGVLVFQSNADYVHEFSNSQRFVNVRFVQDFRPDPQTFRFQTERPVRDFFNVGVSLVAVFPNGVQTFVNLEAMIGNEQFDNYAATLGVRFEL
jgi:uncharacterized protein with beta-barrel porin domain